jgi:hypothetical protein
MKRVILTDKFTADERVKFLREIVKDLKSGEIRQATVVVLRNDGAIGFTNLNPRGYITEVIGMLDRAKLEMFADLRDNRKENSK